MPGIAMLLPNIELLQIAGEICKDHSNVIICKRTLNENVEADAKEAVKMGASVIVARGTQAERIRYTVDIPVVDIVWTAQEIGLTILKAKEMIKDTYPVIGIIGLKSMFCDTVHFETLFHAKIKTFYYTSIEEKESMFKEVDTWGADMLIGAQDILRQFGYLNIPVLPVESTEESVRIAISQAETLFSNNEIKRRNESKVNSLLDSMFNGLIQIDSTGTIVMMNRITEGILNKGQEEVLGKNVKDIIKDINTDLIHQVLNSPRESFSSFLNVNGRAMVMILSPIMVDDQITGAYLSLKKISRNDEIDYAIQEAERRGGFVAYRNFGDICYTSEKMSRLIEQAKLYSQSNTPLMIEGQTGDDRESLCQGIHNYSLRKNGPYVMVSMVGLSQERQMELLFGSGDERRNSQRVIGALEKANGGTLVITGIGFAAASTQSALCRFIRENTGVQLGNGEIKLLDVRLIVTSTESLLQMRKNNTVTFTFYYIFSGLVLRLPPLSERREDVVNFVNLYLKRYTQRYSRYQVLTDEAMDYLKTYNWCGSALQIERFIERMVLTIEKRTIKKHIVEGLLQEMYPDEVFEEGNLAVKEESMDAYEILLRNTLLKNSGNRNATAKDLGISPTTLWRKMKKYGITD
ncbi:sigma 54-interacting transcriptional regulator [Lacrimispora defluvii]|uniref:Sigma 54-interacting transcriptional regulator n=1 Tax=Lacrimispora defluvii TaxID=2719233 RepID=A0ABX1VTR6_9FIRM|nr:sigma 54-interacting transcriptional regulator [Lacrimispora defluvii]NNJ30257.1 sigma 54-interacting transcriptional regulator [Lacrimispora defluvii]